MPKTTIAWNANVCGFALKWELLKDVASPDPSEIRGCKIDPCESCGWLLMNYFGVIPDDKEWTLFGRVRR
jgi:hypothetical protein